MWKDSLTGRISMGFFAVLLLHGIVAVMSHFGLERASREAEASGEQQASLVRVLQIDQSVVGLERNVLAFMYSGDETLAAMVLKSIDDLEQSLNDAGSDHLGVDEPDGEGDDAGDSQSTAIRKMAANVAVYRDGFRSVVADRGVRADVMRESVLPTTARVRESIEFIVNEARASGSAAVAGDAAACLTSFSDAGEASSAYLIEPDGSLVRRFRQRLRDGRDRLAAIDRSALSKDALEALEGIPSDVDLWESEFLRVVNATRSYLHLVNVVLAGQAYEFLKLSTRFANESIEAQRARVAARVAAQHRYQWISNAVGILTILGGLLAGWWISRSVADPIGALTQTFSGLARGRDEDILGVERKDEIGEMARAAEVFAMRNQETQQLLASANEQSAEQARTNVELEQHVIELQRRNDDLDRFSYSASHDLRAPLRSISLLAGWIRDDAGDVLPEESAEHLVTLQSRVLRLQRLLDGLLAYARVVRTTDLSEECTLVPILLELIDSLGGDAGSVTVSGEEAAVHTPRVAITKVFQNLISNALAHSHREDPKVTVTVEDLGDAVRVAVEDDGPGIAKDLHDRVFEIFQTVKRRDEHDTSGIGLAIVKKLCLEHGASIDLTSDGATGSTFTVTWPKRYRTMLRSKALASGEPGSQEVASV